MASHRSIDDVYLDSGDNFCVVGIDHFDDPFVNTQSISGLGIGIGIGIGIGLLKIHIAASKAELHEITV